MRKKILFAMTTLKTGGIATSLVNLLTEVDQLDMFDMDLFLFNTQGDLITSLPRSVHVIKGNWLANLIAISQKDAWENGALEGITRLVLGGMTRVCGDTLPYRFIFAMNHLKTHYDAAISCTQSAPHHRFYGGCNEFILQSVRASKKIAFIHCDYVNYGLNNSYSRKIYSRFDSIAAVSESCRRVIVSAVPEFESKVSVVCNCSNYSKIYTLSGQDCAFGRSSTNVNIVTIARMCADKGHFRVLNVLKRLKDEGYPFCWHVIGCGEKKVEERFREQVRSLCLGEHVKTYGNQVNPFRFLVHASALLVPSVHEAAPMVFDEAKCLGVPILTTDTTSAREMVGDCGFGIVAENSEEGIYSMLKQFLCDPETIACKVKTSCSISDFSNEKAVSQFLHLIEGPVAEKQYESV